MRRYREASGKTFSGVSIQRRIDGVRKTPISVMTTVATMPIATVVWTPRETDLLSPAPISREMTTPAPIEKPRKNPTIR